ncbi:UNVERIFIED_CONTAM: hypothetical protein RMT77_000916 [Armadillidium vulgare]
MLHNQRQQHLHPYRLCELQLLNSQIVNVTVYEQKRLAAFRRKLSVKFLRDCLKEQVIPKTLRPTQFVNHKNQPFPEIYKLIIQNRIMTIQHEINYLFSVCHIHYLAIKCILPIRVFTNYVNIIKTNINGCLFNYREHLAFKLRDLCEHSIWSEFSCAKYSKGTVTFG